MQLKMLSNAYAVVNTDDAAAAFVSDAVPDFLVSTVSLLSSCPRIRSSSV